MVADLRAAAARYPADQRLRHLVADLHAASDRFAELWDCGAVGHHETAQRKTIDHPQVGTLTLDCDVLTVQGSDLHITKNSRGKPRRLGRGGIRDAPGAPACT
jgi:hypothetical protein